MTIPSDSRKIMHAYRKDTEIGSKYQALELIFPGKDTLNRAESFLEDGLVKYLFAPALGCLSCPRILVDVGRHFTIEYRFAIRR